MPLDSLHPEDEAGRFPSLPLAALAFASAMGGCGAPSPEEECLTEAQGALSEAGIFGEVLGGGTEDCVEVEFDGNTQGESITVQCVFAEGGDLWFSESVDVGVLDDPTTYSVCGVGDIGRDMPCVYCVVLSGDRCWSGINLEGQDQSCDWEHFEG